MSLIKYILKFKRIKLVLIFAGILVAFALGYRLGLGVNKYNREFGAIKETREQALPSCDVGRCPEYRSADVDGDGLAESLVYQPIGMTKGVASIWIIKDNKIVFKSQEGAEMSYKLNEDTGITTNFVKEYDDSGLRPKTWEEQKWVYKNGRYALVSDNIK